MSTQAKNALKRKVKMQEKMKEMEDKIKELEEKAQIELGKYIIKEWDIQDDYDSEMIFDVITALKEDAKGLLQEKENDMGKSDM